MLNKGEVIIFPTDTLYSIAARYDDVEAIRRIYNIKGRDLKRRLAILCASLEDIEKIAEVDDRARKLINKYYPGPLTIIMKTKREVMNEFILSNVGVRIPNHPLALRILKDNGPLMNSSVNFTNEDPLNEYSDIRREFGDKVDLIFPNYIKILNVASTVIDMSQGSEIKCIREGAIPFQEILDTLEEGEKDAD